MLRDVLLRIGTEFPAARRQKSSKGHVLADYIRSTAADEVRVALGDLAGGLDTKGSAGAGNWAEVAWLAVFDPFVTTSATRGYYVVYLFSADGSHVHLSLNQGTTAVRSEFKAQARDILMDRAGLMRHRLHDHLDRLKGYQLNLGATGTLPKDYEAGHALGVGYTLAQLPTEDQLRSDLQAMARAYLALTFRGGLDPSLEVKGDGPDSGGDGAEVTLAEARRYRMHRKIERNGRASREAKKVHGLVCQACGFDFSKAYGELGVGYIEAHHLKPLSQLEEGVPVTLNVKVDFAVLCANCHRMIHKSEAPGDVDGLRKVING